LAARQKPKLAATPAAVPRPPWADVLASIDDAIIVLDATGLVLNLNPAAELLIGVSAPQVVGSEAEALFRTSTWVAEMVRGTLAEGTARRRGEGRLSSPRREVDVSAACTPVLDATEALVRGAVLVLHDLTLQRTLETTTRRADRLATLGTVARGLAHEIRNPLGGIKGAAQILRARLTDTELVRGTEIIIREVERLDGLVEQLHELGTPPHLRLEAVNIHRVLNEVIALQRQAVGWGQVTLRTVFDPSLPPVRGDRAQLTQVFLNLVKNAVEALDGTGELSLATHMEARFHIRRGSGRGRFLSVTVGDSGPGVSEDDQARLFSPFFSTKARGTGLGLAVCHRIVSEHGGAIAYEPRNGGGASFRVTLPVSEDNVSDTSR
jgi:two-component system, NtrC family, nitrogen regulation sensor histidine kinase GlnL